MMPALVPHFTEEWFGEESQQVLAALARSAPGGGILEIGSWQGRSTCALANAAYPRIVHAIDTWDGSPGEISEMLAGRRDVYREFLANIQYWTRGNVAPRRLGWRDFLSLVPADVRFALVFIDAEHTYREVADTIAAVLPKMVPGGVICGDDAHHPPVIQAVTEAFGTYQTAATLWIHQLPAGEKS